VLQAAQPEAHSTTEAALAEAEMLVVAAVEPVALKKHWEETRLS